MNYEHRKKQIQPQPKKPLSEITDYDLKQVAALVWGVRIVPHSWYVDRTNGITVMCAEVIVKFNPNIHTVNDIVSTYHNGTKQHIAQYSLLEIFDYLRSRGYDIPNNYSPHPHQTNK